MKIERPGAATAVTTLYAEHALGLVRLAVVMLGDTPAAEDVVQEAFLGLYQRWNGLADPAKALPYVRSNTVPCSPTTEGETLCWTSPDGTAVIGQVQYLGHYETGVFYDGRYVPLPALGGDAVITGRNGSVAGRVPPTAVF